MKRPNKKDYQQGHPQMDAGTELARYSRAQDKYITWLENGSGCVMCKDEPSGKFTETTSIKSLIDKTKA